VHGRTEALTTRDLPPEPLLPPARGEAEVGKLRPRPARLPHIEEGRPVAQSEPTGSQPITAPQPEEHPLIFTSYTPLLDPKNPGLFNLIPPDPSGDDSAARVVLYTGNTYLAASTDSGATFADHDPTAFLPAASGHPVDQVLIYVPHRRLFAWMLQYGADSDGNGTFRLAVAHPEDLEADVERGWVVYDFTSIDLGSPRTRTDRQDLAYGESRLFMTTNLPGVGRVIMSLDLDDLDNGRSVQWNRSDPLDAIYTYSDLSQQNPDDVVYMGAISGDASLQIMVYDSAAGHYGSQDVGVGTFPNVADLVAVDPDGADWLTLGVANVSASLRADGHLWIAWDAAASSPGDKPFYPHAHVRLARVNLNDWVVVEERQVWNSEYAFAYCCLAVDRTGAVGYGVAVGGPRNYPNSCFGILGDFVVYYRDTSTATAFGNGLPRWGDYITVRPPGVEQRNFAAFGYYTEKTPAGPAQRPFHLAYGRP
jgi:hypothetical protein